MTRRGRPASVRLARPTRGRCASNPTERSARTTAELVTNTHCSARRALDAAGVDKSALAIQLGVDSQRGQSPFAINRGNRFEPA